MDRIERNWISLGKSLEVVAYMIFDACGDPDDYCVQTMNEDGDEVVIFGGWNRVLFSSRGWSAIESHCRPDFYAKFQEKFG
jgi:hypothetical protein